MVVLVGSNARLPKSDLACSGWHSKLHWLSTAFYIDFALRDGGFQTDSLSTLFLGAEYIPLSQ